MLDGRRGAAGIDETRAASPGGERGAASEHPLAAAIVAGARQVAVRRAGEPDGVPVRIPASGVLGQSGGPPRIARQSRAVGRLGCRDRSIWTTGPKRFARKARR